MKNYNGDIILANFEKDKIKDSCSAQIRYLNGDAYVGQLKSEKRSGKGQYIYTNGDEYDGLWENNVKKGSGKMTFRNGG